MRLSLKPILSLLVLLLAAPAFAGTVYVPYAADFELGGVTYETRIWISNNDLVNEGTVEYLYLASFQIGTDRENLEPTVLTLAPKSTTLLSVQGDRGWMEIYASEEVFVDARLMPVSGGVSGPGIDLPVVSSKNVIEAGQWANLLGWKRTDDGDSAFTNFGLLNLGHQIANCLIDVYSAAGSLVVNDFPLAINPLSHNEFTQAIGIIGFTDASDWRAALTCDQPFFPYITVQYPPSGRVAFVGPAESGRSELQRPSGGGVSSQFAYLSDLPIESWGGIEVRPFHDASGLEWHPPGGNGPVGPTGPIRIQGVTYEKGVSFYPRWNRTAFVEYRLNGEYALFTAIVRLDDVYSGDYEWAIVDPNTNRWVRLERPSDGFRGRERSNPIRVGGAANFNIKGDGEVLYQSPEIYAYGDPLVIEIDVRGVDVLRLEGHPGGTEQLNAPHRNGLSSPRYVSNCPWLDMIDFADAKLFLSE